MITLNDLTRICAGFAWAKNINTYEQPFEVDVTLPFPFHQALLHEIGKEVSKNNPQITEILQLDKLSLPNGTIISLFKGKDDTIIISPKRQQVIPVNSQLLLPFNSERN
jgi:hypothetical protein